MGQKVNPHGLRVGVIKDWDSRWFESDEKFGDTLVSDYNIRKYLKNELIAAGVPKIEIERTNARVKVIVHCAKPGFVIGKNGSEIERLRQAVENMVGKPVTINVMEVRIPDLDAQLVAENIASQLEKRTTFRRATKLAIGRTMRLGAKGIKVKVGGRLNGAEIARSESEHEGTIPLQTLRADIDYGFWEANTTYGKIGVKVWIYKGEVLAAANGREGRSDDRPRKRFGDRKDGGRRDRDNRGERREGGRRDGRGRGFDRNQQSENRGERANRPIRNHNKPVAEAPVEAAAETPTEGGTV